MLQEFLEIFQHPVSAIFIMLTITLLECALSFDNSVILAMLVKDLPEKDQNKALHWGIIGAYVFRGLGLFFASYLISIWFLKPIGGLYLLWLTYKYFKGKQTESEDDDYAGNKKDSLIYKSTVGILGVLWSTILMVEFMDIIFSIDNILSVVAFSPNFIMIFIGTCIGILAMRFVSQKVIKLIAAFPFIETCAFIVIGMLGVKLSMSAVVHYVPSLSWIESETFDFVISGLTLLIFAVPIATSYFFNFPARSVAETSASEEETTPTTPEETPETI